MESPIAEFLKMQFADKIRRGTTKQYTIRLHCACVIQGIQTPPPPPATKEKTTNHKFTPIILARSRRVEQFTALALAGSSSALHSEACNAL